MSPFQALWDRLQRLGSPIPVQDHPDATPLAAPALAQDEFPLTGEQVVSNYRRDVHLHELHRRLIETNNAHVTRGMGRYTELIAHRPNVKPLSAAEMAEMASPIMLGAVFVDAGPRE